MKYKLMLGCFFLFSDMFIVAGEFLKAIEILGENCWADKYGSYLFVAED